MMLQQCVDQGTLKAQRPVANERPGCHHQQFACCWTRCCWCHANTTTGVLHMFMHMAWQAGSWVDRLLGHHSGLLLWHM
jgi:hypothetical protein